MRAYSADDYKRLLKSLLPRGVLWLAPTDGLIDKLLSALGIELNRVDVRTFDVRNEVYPITTDELINEHNEDLGLPEPMFFNANNDVVQRDRITKRHTMRADTVSAEYYEALAEDWNYDILIQEFSPYLALQIIEGQKGSPFGPYNPTLPTTPPAKFISWDDPGTALIDDTHESYAVDKTGAGTASVTSTDTVRAGVLHTYAGTDNDSYFACIVEDGNGVLLGGYARGTIATGLKIYDSTSGGSRAWDRHPGTFNAGIGNLRVRMFQL